MKSRPFEKLLLALFTAATALSASAAAPDGKELNILNWSEYISPEAISLFEKQNGVHIRYDQLDSNETLQAKLLGGNSGYDVVYPAIHFMPQQIKAGVYEKLDWSKLPNSANLDPELMAKLATMDPGNQYGVPYLWGSIGLIVNMTKVRAILGADAEVKGWDLLLDPAVASKLSACGLSVMDAATNVFPTVLAHMGRDPNSQKVEDYQDAYKELAKVRPYITQFSSSYLNDVVSGDICVAAGWSGDATVIQQRMAEAGLPDEIVYITPRGETALWFTMMGVPKDARNKDTAYQWINHLLSKEMAASTTNALTYTTAVPGARALVKPELQASAVIFPAADDVKTFFALQPLEPKVNKTVNKLWLRFKSEG